MELSQLNPWNWFKHEEPNAQERSVPVKRDDYVTQSAQGGGTDIWQLHREMDRLFDEVFRDFGWPSRRMGGGLSSDNQNRFRPRLNVASDDKQYTITLETPGLAQDDIKLELKDRALFIQGEKRFEQEDKDKHYYRIERHYGQFQRVLDLPDDVELDKIDAKMQDGVLTVHLPRLAKANDKDHRQITIQS